jgi:hypothetical protein
MRRTLAFLLLALAGCGEGPSAPASSKDPEPEPAVTAVGVRWEDRKPDGTGRLVVLRSDGSEATVATDAIDSWFSNDKRALYYSYRHLKSGYEREGMGLKRYLAATGESEVVFEHDKMVLLVREVASASGKPALIVDTIDGGRGAPEVVVADPERGRVHVIAHARSLASPDVVRIAHYTDAQIDEAEGYNFPEPDRTEDLDLDPLLNGAATRETPNPLPED